MGPLIEKASRDPRYEVVVISTGQHRELVRPIYKFFDVAPKYDFDLMRPGQSLHDITIGVLEKMRQVIRIERPDWVLVQGDTTSAMAASLCAFYDQVKVAHVEAGLRTDDIWSPWPEEFNRRVTALIADLHFAPTSEAAANLLRERLDPEHILVTGNTGIDALLQVRERLQNSAELNLLFQQQFSFLDPERRLILATIHRRESFGDPMRSILRGLSQLSQRPDVEVLIPLHPNPEVRKAVSEVLGDRAQWVNSRSRPGESRIWLMEPLEYLSFVYAMNRSDLIISDSGGVQEEAPSLGKPVLVVRETTERPEAVAAGTSKLIGADGDRIFREASLLLNSPIEYAKMNRPHNPYGDGRASERILRRIWEFEMGENASFQRPSEEPVFRELSPG